jgi:hypothetical protein
MTAPAGQSRARADVLARRRPLARAVVAVIAIAALWPAEILIRDAIDYLRMRDWVAVQATLEAYSTRTVRQSRSSASTVPTVRFRYAHGKNDCTGRMVNVSHRHGEGQIPAEQQQELARAIETGAPVTAWVNPAAACDAVLYRDYPVVWHAKLLGLLMMAVLAAVAIWRRQR